MRPALCPARASLLIFLVLVLPSPGKAVVSGGGDPLATETYDIRVFGGAALARLKEAYASPRLMTAEAKARERARSLAEASERLRSLAPGARIELSPLPSGVEVVASTGTPLTVAEPGLDGAAVVRGFLRSWPGIYGLSAEQIEHLEVLSESRQDGLTLVRLRQTVNGRPVFQSDTRAVLDREGRLLHTVGRLIPAIDEAAVPTEWRVGSREALRAALASVGSDLDLVTRPATSEQVYFPLAPGVVVPAWVHVAFTRGPADWYTVVDARTGTLLWRKNIRYNLAAKATDTICAEVYLQPDGQTPADSPAPDIGTNHGSRTVVQLDAAITQHKLTNNNVIAYLNRDGDESADSTYPPPQTQATRKVHKQTGNCTPPFLTSDGREVPPKGDASPEEYSSGAVADLFYLVNWFHDRLSDLGFNEAAGNFQKKTPSAPDDDPVHAEAQYAAGAEIFNLASFSSPPDGSPGLLRMSVWNGPDPHRDASLDAQIVFHELAHGVTSRLIGNGACLNWYPGRALAEGWSDFYALALLNGTDSDNPDGSYSIGGYTAYKLGGHADFTDNYLFGLRRFPYSTQMTVNPLTWKDVDDTTSCANDRGCFPGVQGADKLQSSLRWENGGANEIHNAGELWALSLWEMRSRIIEKLGGVGHRAEGNEIALAIVTESLSLQPMLCDPSFIEARNLLIEAACPSPYTDTACQYEESIWQAFAKRGLGSGAHDSGGVATHYGIHESFLLPVLDLAQDPIVSNGASSVLRPEEEASLTITLKNPWRSRSITADVTLACAHALSNGSATYSLPPQAVATNKFKLTPNEGLAAGADLGCHLELVSNNLDDLKEFELTTLEADTLIALNLRVGERKAAPGDSVTCTWNSGAQAANEGLPCEKIECMGVLHTGEIPDGDLRGRCFTLGVKNDFVVDSVALQINDLTHPWVGDLTVLLKGQNDYGTELIYRLAKEVVPGLPLLGASPLQCLKGTVIQAGGKDFLSKNPGSCFAGEWAPPLESSRWLTSSEGQLDRFKGISSKGAWTLFITDVVPDGGPKLDQDGNPIPLRLDSWTLVITPATYQ